MSWIGPRAQILHRASHLPGPALLLSEPNSYEQKLFLKSSEAFLNIKSLHYAEQKDHQHVLTKCFEKHFEQKTWFYLASQKRNVLALSHLF